MKSYQIKEGGVKYQLAENAADLNIVRYSALKNIIAEESSGMKMPELIEWFATRRQFYNSNDMYALMQSEINMARQVQENSSKIFNDASHRIFSLIVTEDGEDLDVVDSTRMDEKLQRMSLEGLTQREVFSVTENFIGMSPQLCNSFFLMSLSAMAKTLKSSEPMPTQLADQLEAKALTED